MDPWLVHLLGELISLSMRKLVQVHHQLQLLKKVRHILQGILGKQFIDPQWRNTLQAKRRHLMLLIRGRDALIEYIICTHHYVPEIICTYVVLNTDAEN